MSFNAQSVEKVRNLLCPESIAIIGASSKGGSWSEISWHNLQRFGYSGPIYLINPRYETLWDTPCYSDVDALPGRPDHLLVNVPAKAVISVLLNGAKAGARSATIFAGGFGEGGDAEGKELRRQLEDVITRTGIAVSGPNCMGHLCAYSQAVTITDKRIQNIETGPVAIVGQSGGIVMAINRSLSEREIRVGYMITSGNEIGLTTADYIQYLAQETDVRVIVAYMESIRNPEQFLEACLQAKKAGKPVVMIKMGGSEAGRTAALAHTGALAGSLQAFDAVTGEAGVIRVDNLDDVVETVEYLVHTKLPKGPGIGAITFSGGLKGLLLESAERQGITFPKLSAETEQQLKELLPVGTSVGNPLDSGFGGLSSQETYFRCIELMFADPYIDVLLLQEELPRQSTPSKEDNLRKLNDKAGAGMAKPLGIVSMISHSQSEYSRGLRREWTNLPFLQEVDKALRATQAVIRYSRSLQEPERDGEEAESPKLFHLIEPHLRDVSDRTKGNATGLIALDEMESKRILSEYGIPVLRETAVQSVEEALRAAEILGSPVVLKGISAKITHKSDAGIVKVGLRTNAEVKAAYEEICRNMHLHGGEGSEVLVAPFINGGLEVVLGIHRDPEMGPIVMFGSGGVWLELFKDVKFGKVPLSPLRARELIEHTKAGRLLHGFRGDAPRDVDAVVSALVGISRLANDLGDSLETIDVNPFTVLPKGYGGYALDGLIVLRGLPFTC